MFHSALGSIAGLLLSFSSAKPFFEKITLPAEAPTEKEEPAKLEDGSDSETK